jgi:hypothetical protein
MSNIEPSPKLIEFRQKYCPHLSFDDPELLFLLLEKIKGDK